MKNIPHSHTVAVLKKVRDKILKEKNVREIKNNFLSVPVKVV